MADANKRSGEVTRWHYDDTISTNDENWIENCVQQCQV